MDIVDTLSQHSTNNSESQSEFEKDIEIIRAFDGDASLNGQFQELKAVTAEDSNLIAVSKHIQEGWPNDMRDVSPLAKAYYNFMDGLVTENGLVLKGTRNAIPTKKRQEILKQLHGSLMDVEATLRRVRETVFWPGINGAVH